MVHIVIRMREIVSSNVSALAEAASDPVKMLRLLRQEIEDSDVALHGELSRMTRAQNRAEAAAAKAGEDAKGWSAKAKTAMDHGREDLARSALLAREDARLAAETHSAEAKRLAAEIAETGEVLEGLKARLAETNAHLRKLDSAARSESGSGGSKDSATDRRLDRIDALERRVAHALDDDTQTRRSHASIEAEIAAMTRDASVEAELAKLRGGKTAQRKA